MAFEFWWQAGLSDVLGDVLGSCLYIPIDVAYFLVSCRLVLHLSMPYITFLALEGCKIQIYVNGDFMNGMDIVVLRG